MTDVFDQVDRAEFHDGELDGSELDGGGVHGEELTEAELDELEALGAAEDAELILGELDA